jgi:hypothetical protein
MSGLDLVALELFGVNLGDVFQFWRGDEADHKGSSERLRHMVAKATMPAGTSFQISVALKSVLVELQQYARLINRQLLFS